jgi:hypothetical protein
VLHGTEHRYFVAVLRDGLECELDRLLLSMVFERGAIELALLAVAEDARFEAAAERASAEVRALQRRRAATVAGASTEAVARLGEAYAETVRQGRRVVLNLVQQAIVARDLGAAQGMLDANAAYEQLGCLAQVGDAHGAGLPAPPVETGEAAADYCVSGLCWRSCSAWRGMCPSATTPARLGGRSPSASHFPSGSAAA